MATTTERNFPANDLPMWVQILGGLWCLLAVIIFVRQILIAYISVLTGG